MFSEVTGLLLLFWDADQRVFSTVVRSLSAVHGRSTDDLYQNSQFIDVAFADFDCRPYALPDRRVDLGNLGNKAQYSVITSIRPA